MAKRSYISDIPVAPLKKHWRKLFNFHLVDTNEKLSELAEEFKKNPCDLAVDTETTSLSIVSGYVVGFSFCWDSRNAYYVPLYHKVGSNVESPEQAMSVLKEMMEVAPTNLFFNYQFDMRMLRKYGVEPMKVNFLDVQTLVWNLDTNKPMPALKDSARWLLGIETDTFQEFLGASKLDISYTAPEDATNYAAADALLTQLINMRLQKFYEGNQGIVRLDNELTRVLMFLEETPVPIDLSFAKQAADRRESAIEEVKREIYAQAGRHFELDSPAQLLRVLLDLGVPLTETTRKGRLTTSEKAIKGFAEDYKIVADIFKYRSLSKGLNSYIKPFLRNDKDGVYFSYLSCAVPTARLASGGPSKKDPDPLFLKMNIQSYPKPEPAMYSVKKSDSDKAILGWEFSLDENGTVEGFAPGALRNIIKPLPGHCIVDVDYDSEELVIAGNLTSDEAFVKPLSTGGDVHKDVACRMFGADNYNKSYRRIAKALNFGCLYGGDAYTLKRKLPQKSLEECEEYYNLWCKSHRTYLNYMKSCFKVARKTGYIKTLLGRTRRVRYWYKQSRPATQAFADRTVANTQIQGAAGDILRFVMIRLFYKMLTREKNRGKVQFLITIHDEIVFSVTKEPKEFNRIVSEIREIMTELPFSDWRAPVKTSVTVGPSWGCNFPFKFVDGEWVPEEE